MKSNLEYFEYSIKHPDELLDLSNPKGNVVISKYRDEKKSKQQEDNVKLLDLITTYHTLKQNDIAKEAQDSVVLKIIDLLDTSESVNYSAFCAYFQVLNFSYSSYREHISILSKDQKLSFVKAILDNYLIYRHESYLSHGYRCSFTSSF